MRWKPALLALLMLVSWAPLAAAAHRRAHEHAEVVPETLAEVHVLGGRPAPFALDARSALLIEVHSGETLYAYHEHEPIQPASLAKIMTFYIVLEALKAGKLSLTTQIPISEAAWRLSIDKTVSKMFLEVGQQVPVQQLLYGLMVSSGNDAAVALAEYLGGSSDGFVAIMNDYCHKLGLDETRFASPDGLPEPNQYTTASDMVKLGRLLLERFPDALAITSLKEFTFHQIEQRNWNTLMFYDARVDGIKTGHVDEAGFHLVATAHQGDLRFISAVMGAPNAERRRTETEKLLEWAFRTFSNVTPQWRAILPSSLPVYEGRAGAVEVAPARTVSITVFKGDEARIKMAGSMEVNYLVAPVRAGMTVGTLTARQDAEVLFKLPVQTLSAVARGGFFKVFWDRLGLAVHRLGHRIGAALRACVSWIPYFGHRAAA